MIVGALLGTIIVLVSYSIFLNPPNQIPSVDQISVNTKNSITAQNPGELSLVEIFEKSEAGVVRINVKRPNTDPRGIGGVGSGFVYDSNGHIITNDHVVENAEKLTVTFLDGRSYKAKIIG